MTLVEPNPIVEPTGLRSAAGPDRVALNSSAGVDDLKCLVRELHLRDSERQERIELLEQTVAKLEQNWTQCVELFEQAPVGYLDLDSRGYIRQINQTGAALLGKGVAELLGKALVSFIVPRDIHRFVSHLKQTLEQPGRRSTELRLRRANAPSLAVQVWSIAAHEPEATQPLCRTTLTDITERKLAEEALHESIECFRIMTDTAPVLVWMSGTDGAFTYCNKAWLEFTGRALKQELGNGWTEVVHPDDLPRYLDCYQTAFKAREKFNLEFRLRRHETQYRWFLNRGIPRFTPQGEFAGYIGSCLDITERKEAEEMRRAVLEDLEVIVQERTANLKSANLKLRQEIATRKQLEKQIIEITDREQRRIGIDLHDGLGQQLTGVAFLSKVLEQKLASKEYPEVTQAAQIHKLVNQALNQTRELARGLHVVELQSNGLLSALQDLKSQMENLYAIRCRLKWEKNLCIHDPAVATHLYRIAQEAANNAVKHAQAKNIYIRLAVSDKRITLTIRDDGTGLPKNMSEQQGMGLHTMRYRSEMIRGTFEIQRAPGGGTIVLCSFPLKENKQLVT